ncbi:hypothetical protein CDL15_Pgr013404 [Punica granatum]|uniref:Alcohol dehydrogenase-like C-terminal domain-containing protein n=1 Tax=Punica granatum TaxID=22663 RepID=A0A218W028_PUNGR|nr:hypothetical protein CDL15_Pgr013404 [Punica granatum]
MILTYNTKDRDGSTTYGGYSDIMVTDEHYAVAIPDNLPLDWAPPSLCAGITAYSPLKNYGHNRPGLHVGVVGLGGLGHVTVKFAKAMGPKVTVISTSPSKKEEAIDRLGADWFLVSSDPEQMQVGGKIVAGSCTGGLTEMQEMINFASEHNITSDIAVIPLDYVNTAMNRLTNGDVRYRFVIDIKNTLRPAA